MKAILQAFFMPLSHLSGFWTPFLIACIAVISLEAVFEHWIEADDGFTQTIFSFSGLYQSIVAAPRDPLPRYTAVVEIDPKKDVAAISQNYIPAQRKMISQLLCRVASSGPSVIVVDKYFLSPPTESDANLRRAVQDIMRQGIPIVVGRDIEDESDKKPHLLDSLRFTDGYASTDLQVQEGVVNIDKDTRRLPLKWQLFAKEEPARKADPPSWHNTLSLSAAWAYDSELLAHHPRLAKFVETQNHPYISFLKKDAFPHMGAGEILEEVPTRPAIGSSFCPARSASQEMMRTLHSKFVLIGEISRDLDEHATVVGRMPGLYAQSNYLEALLDDRYFRPVLLMDYLLGFIFMVGLELILIVFKDKLWKMALLIVVLFASFLLLLYLITMHLGWYVNPVPVTAVTVLIKVMHMSFGPAERAVPGS